MGFWPSDLQGWTIVVQGVVVAAGGLWAVKTFVETRRQKAAEILLQVESEFRSVQRTCDHLTTPGSYEGKFQGPLAKSLAGTTLAPEELERRDEVDRALRFFYFCCVLNAQLGVDLATLRQAYYFYLTEFVDEEKRPELSGYVRRWYPRLFAWIGEQEARTAP